MVALILFWAEDCRRYRKAAIAVSHAFGQARDAQHELGRFREASFNL
jgi:hypothetical protein